METSTRFDSNRLIENRQIRIFLSSTFSDMQEERSALVKTFEKLKVSAARRNVTLSLLDLRWGVTDEEARSGKVISVCLNEIEHSHPFFIGLLGNRYGYAPDSMELNKNHDLLERYPWLAKDIADGRSITEIEMLYGALRNSDHPVDATFFIKKTSEPDDNPKQTALKEKIRNQKQYPVKDYTNVEELCLLVEHQVNEMINRLFPDGERTPLESERTAQRAYINSRHSHFVGREEELDYLDNFVRSNRRHLVITGDSGMGKSALLADWIRHNYKNDSFNLVYHFVGNSFVGSSYESVLHHLCDEIYDLYKIDKDPNRQEKPEDEAQRLVSELVNKQMPLVVVVDGINQIIAPKDEKLLLWLPSANEKVKFIFTTLRDDTTMQTFERRGYEVLTLEALSDTQREHFAIEYLEQVGKHLDGQLLQRIIHDAKNCNTLVLRTLLDELICFGSHEHLTARAEYYLSANSIPNFFDRVLQRMEQDYNNDQDLVCRVLSLIASSEHGLSEEELLAITGFRQMDWHLFYCSFFNHLVEKEGLITFSHQYVTDAINRRYAIDNADVSTPCRHEIVAYFAAKVPNDEVQYQRCISELAHQYYNLKDWNNLHNTLLNFEAFLYYYSHNILLLAGYWRALLTADKKHYRLSDYLHISEPKEETALAGLAASLNYIGSFVSDYFAEYDIALEYYSKALVISEKVLGIEHPCTAYSLNNIGLVYQRQNDYGKALEYHHKAMSIFETIFGAENPNIAVSYNSIGLLYDEQGNYDKALEYYLMAVAILEKAFGAEHPDVATSYNNIGMLYRNLGIYDKALEYNHNAVAIREKVLGMDHFATAQSYNNIGLLYCNLGIFEKALEYYFKALAILERVFGREHPDTAQLYNNIGWVYIEQGEYDKALEYNFMAVAIRERIFGKKHSETAQSYNNIGWVYREQGEYDKALEYHFKAMSIFEIILGTEHPNIAISCNNIGLLYYRKGDYDKALEYHFKALVIREKVLGTQHPDTSYSYNNIGLAYMEQGNYDQAMEYHLKALAIQEKVLGKKHPDTAVSYNSVGWVCRMQGQYSKALKYYHKALTIQEKVLGTEHLNTATSYSNIGEVYYYQGDYKKALKYLNKAYLILLKLLGQEHPDTITVLESINVVKEALGSNE